MSAARHFHTPDKFKGNVRDDIEADIKVFREIGSTKRMDDALDELIDLNNGTWKPKHA